MVTLSAVQSAPVPVRCVRCGRSSPLAGFYRATWRGRLCPRCGADREGRLWLVVLGAAALAALLTAALVRLPAGQDLLWWHYLLANVVLHLIFLSLLVVPHELAHALAARLVGGRVYGIHLGSGPLVFECRLFGVDVVLQRYLQQGHCLAIITPGPALRLRQTILLGAGMVFNLVLMNLLWPGLVLDHLWTGYALPEALFFACVVHLAMSVLPNAKLNGVAAPPDGMQLLQLLLAPSQPKAIGLMSDVAEAVYTFQRGEFAGCLAACQRGLAQDPAHLPLRSMLALAYLGLDRYPEALAIFDELLSPAGLAAIAALYPAPEQAEAARARQLNNAAWTAVSAGARGAALLPARQNAEEAYRLLPWEASVEGTLGTLLTWCGQPAAGLPYLEAAYRAHTTTRNRGAVAAALAVAHSALARPDAAGRWLAEAQRFAPQEPIVKHAAAELAGCLSNNTVAARGEHEP